MADCRIEKVERRHAKIAHVPIAITPEGFWCCPSPVGFQRTLKSQQILHKPKRPTPPPPKVSVQVQNHLTNKKQLPTPLRQLLASSDDERSSNSDPADLSPLVVSERSLKPDVEKPESKVAVVFGDPKTSDLIVVLSGKQGFSARMSVHRNVLIEHSSLFADKLSQPTPASLVEIGNCVDLEVYVETIGLMYCNEMKQLLIRQNVAQVLRILKVAESLGFSTCIQICLEYLESAPWVDEEEEKVVSSVLGLGSDRIGVHPVLERVSFENSNSPNDTVAHIIQLVLKSNEEKGQREMKSLVSKLLKESNFRDRSTTLVLNENIYNSCQNCLCALLNLFRQASDPGLTDKSMDGKSPMARQIALEADSLLWLVEILTDRKVADEFVALWASQNELAMLHPKLSIMSRYIVSCITARLFVGIGKGEMLPVKDVRKRLLQIWLQPLMDDYRWLRYGCRSFDGKMVEEGIGQTVLTLPLEDQQSILLGWLGSFLKVGDNCPNLQKAFEVWWRRAFVRPYVDHKGQSIYSTQLNVIHVEND